MRFNNRSDEVRVDPLEITSELSHSDIAGEKVFVNPLEGAQEIADIGPHPFDGVDVDFPNPITVIISGPFTKAVADG